MIVDVIISDLVPLKERGNYIAIILTVYFIGMAVGMFHHSQDRNQIIDISGQGHMSAVESWTPRHGDG